MKKIVLSYLLILISLVSYCQQDTQYGLYQFNQMAINPAYAGARDAIATVMDLRNQWVGFSGAPTTLAFTIHAPTFNNKLGVGLNVLSDQIGAKGVTGAYGNFAYIAKLNNKYKLSFGLRAGYLNYKFNFSKVTYKESNEPTSVDLANINRTAFDMDAGLFLKSNSFFFGLSATHLTNAKLYATNYSRTNASGITQTYNTNYILNPHVFAIVGKAFPFGDNLVFNPTVMLKIVNSQSTFDLNFNLLIKQRVWIGTFIRQGYGVGALLQVYATDKLRIGYSYDIGTGTRKLLGSSHELMLGFDFGNYKAKTLSPRFL